MFASDGLDELGRPLNLVENARYENGTIHLEGRARAYESTLLLAIDNNHPVIVQTSTNGRWIAEGSAMAGSLISIGDEDAKGGGMSKLTTIKFRISRKGEVELA